MKITAIKALEVLDSRANPTVRAYVHLENGIKSSATVPSGASTGTYEALELRDKDKKRYLGRGVLQAVKNIENIIAPALVGKNVENQNEIDELMLELDGTKDKSRLGANAILAVSLAVCKAGAKSLSLPLYEYIADLAKIKSSEYILPLPMMNVLNGGAHANWSSDIQEYMIMPISATSVCEAIRQGAELYQNLKSVIKSRGYSTLVGDEGGFAPAVKDNSEPFTLLKEASDLSGFVWGKDIALAIDVAASEFYNNGKYQLKREGLSLSSDELSEYFSKISQKYPLYSLEDVFSEDDFESFAKFHKAHPRLQLVGDDLYVTNLDRLKKGVKEKVTNSILIKLNQIGSLSETIEVVNYAKEQGIKTVISHRSGESEDAFIADLAVGLQAGQIKTGAPCRSERVAKYNRLLEIESELNGNSHLASGLFN
jgi:enolase